MLKIKLSQKARVCWYVEDKTVSKSQSILLCQKVRVYCYLKKSEYTELSKSQSILLSQKVRLYCCLKKSEYSAVSKSQSILLSQKVKHTAISKSQSILLSQKVRVYCYVKSQSILLSQKVWVYYYLKKSEYTAMSKSLSILLSQKVRVYCYLKKSEYTGISKSQSILTSGNLAQILTNYAIVATRIPIFLKVTGMTRPWLQYWASNARDEFLFRWSSTLQPQTMICECLWYLRGTRESQMSTNQTRAYLSCPGQIGGWELSTRGLEVPTSHSVAIP